jgi:hypothetical protein
MLAKPGAEYLVLRPSETGNRFTLTVPPGAYTAEWFSVTGRESLLAGELTITDVAEFKPPFEPAGPAVLYLTRID